MPLGMMRGLQLGLPQRLDEPRLASRLAWLTGLRLGLLTLLLGLLASFYLRRGFELGSFSGNLVLVTLAIAYGLAGVYAALLRRGTNLVALAYAQLALDQLTWTALVYVSGGPASGATAFYGLTCLTGAILVGLRGATVAALTGVGLYLGLCFGFGTSALSPPPDQSTARYAIRFADMAYPVMLNLLVMMIVTLLAGYLAERLRLTGGRLVEANLRAERAERLAALGRLAAGLAHEIRNPLGSILGSVQLLHGSPGLDDEARELCNLVERETARLNDLVSDMLDLARPRQPALGPVDIAQIARDVLALASRSGRGSDVELRYEGLRALIVQADAGQLRQVVWNLVRNAIQVSSPGARVLVRVMIENGVAVLDITDEGPGIPSDARSQIFDAFFTTRSSGVGVGLAVVKRVIDDHGFRIEVISRRGEGATFRVELLGALLKDEDPNPNGSFVGDENEGGNFNEAPAYESVEATDRAIIRHSVPPRPDT